VAVDFCEPPARHGARARDDARHTPSADVEATVPVDVAELDRRPVLGRVPGIGIGERRDDVERRTEAGSVRQATPDARVDTSAYIGLAVHDHLFARVRATYPRNTGPTVASIHRSGVECPSPRRPRQVP
jgi:hypothetical protein